MITEKKMGKLLESLLVLRFSQNQQEDKPCYPCTRAYCYWDCSDCFWQPKPFNIYNITIYCTSIVSYIFAIRSTNSYSLSRWIADDNSSFCKCSSVSWTSTYFHHWPICPWDSASLTPCTFCLHHGAIYCCCYSPSWTYAIHHSIISWSSICSIAHLFTQPCKEEQWNQSQTCTILLRSPPSHIPWLSKFYVWHVITLPW